jgi:hypothetical protein
MYSNLDLLQKGEADGVEFRKRLHCFTQVLEASISNDSTGKKRDIE